MTHKSLISMKTTQIIKRLLIVSAVSLTLASCGGGGGGESSSGSNNNSTDNSVQQETFSAPERLSSGMEFTMTSTETGKISKFIITSPTGFVDESGASASMEYTKTGDKTCSISYKYDSSPMVTLGRKFVFTSATGGDYYHGDKKVGTFTFVSNSGNDSSADGESNDGTSSEDSTQLAPESLPVGTVINLHANSGTISSYTLNSDSNCTSNSGAKLTWEYSVTDDNTAEWVAHNSLNIPLTYKLVFTSAAGGSYTCVNAGGEGVASGTFNLSDKSDAPTQGNDDTSNDTNQDDEEAVVIDYAPESRSGIKSIDFGPYSFGSSGVYQENLRMSGYYSYKKTGPNKAYITVSGMEYEATIQCSETLINGRFYIRNVDKVLMSAEASFYVEFISDTEIRIEGEETVTNYSYNTNKLSCPLISERDTNRSYNTTGTWKSAN